MATTVAFDIIARDRASKTFDHVGDSAGRSSGKLKQFAKVGALAVAAVAVVAAKALWDMGKAAIEDEKSQAILAKQLRNSAGATDEQVKSTEKWITAQGKALGVADDELRPALARLVTSTGDIGKAQKLAALAMDISAAKGKPLAAVTEALAKAQNGNTAGLSKMGVAVKDADGKSRSLNEITKELSKTYSGSAANAANTTAGKFARLKLMFDETKEAIGAKLLPIGLKLANFLLGLSNGSSGLGNTLRNKLGPAFQAVAGWVKGDLLPALMKLWRQVAPGLKQVMSAVGDELRSAGPLFRLLGRIVTSVILPAMGILYKTALPLLASGLRATGKLLRAIGVAGIWMWNNALQPVFSFLAKAIGKTLGYFGRMLQQIGKVPKMGWVGDLGDKLVNAGQDADGLSGKIRKIPDRSVRISADTSSATASLNSWLAAANSHAVRVPVYRSGATPGGAAGHNALGTSHWEGGGTWVGETGPEFLDVPRGAAIRPSAQARGAGGGGLTADDVYRAFRRALAELPAVRLPDAGRGAQLQGARFS